MGTWHERQGDGLGPRGLDRHLREATVVSSQMEAHSGVGLVRGSGEEIGNVMCQVVN